MMFNINGFLGEVKFDILRVRPGEPSKSYSCGNDEIERGRIARTAFKEALPGDVLYVAPGIYRFPHQEGNVLLPNGVRLVGSGKGFTKFSSNVHSDAEGTAFVLQNTIAQGISFEHTLDYQPFEDGRCVGFDPQPGQTKGFDAKLLECEIIGDAWTVYNWNNLGNKIYLYGCNLKYGRLGLAAMASGSESQFFTAINCVFDGDASRAKDVGATSNPVYGGVYGAVCRSGMMRLIDCEMILRGGTPQGSSYTPRVLGISDTFETRSDGSPIGANSQTRFEVTNLRCTTIPNGSSYVYDIHFSFANIQQNARFQGGWGSLAGGGFSIKTAPPATVSKAKIDDSYKAMKRRDVNMREVFKAQKKSKR